MGRITKRTLRAHSQSNGPTRAGSRLWPQQEEPVERHSEGFPDICTKEKLDKATGIPPSASRMPNQKTTGLVWC